MKNESVFPQTKSAGDVSISEGGLTLRDYFAAHAPEPPKSWRFGEKKIIDIIDWRWYYADAMIQMRDWDNE